MNSLVCFTLTRFLATDEKLHTMFTAILFSPNSQVEFGILGAKGGVLMIDPFQQCKLWLPGQRPGFPLVKDNYSKFEHELPKFWETAPSDDT